MHVAVADAPSQWRLGKVLDRNRKKLTDTLNRTPAELTAAQHLVSSANDAFPSSSRACSQLLKIGQPAEHG
jgi:hypothetical protein